MPFTVFTVWQRSKVTEFLETFFNQKIFKNPTTLIVFRQFQLCFQKKLKEDQILHWRTKDVPVFYILF